MMTIETNDNEITFTVNEQQPDHKKVKEKRRERFYSFLETIEGPMRTIAALLIIAAVISMTIAVACKWERLSNPLIISEEILGNEDVRFHPSLQKAIEKDEIDIAQVQLNCCEGNYYLSGPESDRLKITHVEWVMYSDEYMKTYFSPDLADKLREAGKDGYYIVTVGLK